MAPYLRLKITEGLKSFKYSLLQYSHEEKIEKKSRNCFEFFSKSFWSPISRTVPEKVKGGPSGVFEHPFFCKIEKN